LDGWSSLVAVECSDRWHGRVEQYITLSIRNFWMYERGQSSLP